MKEGFLPIQAIIDEVEETKEEFNVKSLKQQYGQMKEAKPKERLNKIERNEEKNGNKMQVLLRGNNHMENLCCKSVKDFYIYLRKKVFKEPIANNFWKKMFY